MFKKPFILLAAMLLSATLYSNAAVAACGSPTGDEGDVAYDSANKKMQFCDGTNWLDFGGGGATPVTPVDVKFTTSTHDGDFGGWAAMFAWVQANGCSGYEICRANDIMKFIEHGGTIADVGQVRTIDIATGAPGDAYCSDWNSSNSSGSRAHGKITTGGAGFPTYDPDGACGSVLPFACCKF